jgi:hypothetical protein
MPITVGRVQMIGGMASTCISLNSQFGGSNGRHGVSGHIVVLIELRSSLSVGGCVLKMSNGEMPSFGQRRQTRLTDVYAVVWFVASSMIDDVGGHPKKLANSQPMMLFTHRWLIDMASFLADCPTADTFQSLSKSGMYAQNLYPRLMKPLPLLGSPCSATLLHPESPNCDREARLD